MSSVKIKNQSCNSFPKAKYTLEKRTIIQTACILTIVAYKVSWLIRYGINYADDDQCLMWYGTAMFAHGKIPEPCFLGQSYGAMLESILAVPLYWLGIPLNVALPLVTAILSTLPIILMIIICKKELSVVLITCSFLMMSYAVDALLIVPRNLVGGICVTTLACLCMAETQNVWIRSMLATAACIGVVVTNSAVIILAAGGGHLFLKEKLFKNMFPFAVGGVLSGGYYFFVQWFYNKNPDFNLHGGISISYDFHQLKGTRDVLLTLLEDLTVFSSWKIAVILILISIVYGILHRRWDYLFPEVIGIIGCIALMGLPKVNDYAEGVLFSRLRMFLFVPYLICLVVYIASKHPTPTNDWSGIKNLTMLILCFLALGSVFFKGYQITDNLKSEGDLTYTGVVRVGRTEKFMEENEEILKDAEKENVDWIISMTDWRMEAYALAAQGYGKHHFYNATYDRRTWEYQEASKPTDGTNVMLLWRDTDGYSYELCWLEGKSITSYLYNTYGLKRRP